MGVSRGEQIKINGKVFVRDLKDLSRKSADDLALEIFATKCVFHNAVARNSIRKAYYEYFCDRYGLRKDNYIIEPEKKEPEPYNGSSESVEKTVASINSTLFELNKTMKSMQDTMLKMSGYIANINLSASETKISTKELLKEFRGE